MHSAVYASPAQSSPVLWTDIENVTVPPVALGTTVYDSGGREAEQSGWSERLKTERGEPWWPLSLL